MNNINPEMPDFHVSIDGAQWDSFCIISVLQCVFSSVDVMTLVCMTHRAIKIKKSEASHVLQRLNNMYCYVWCTVLHFTRMCLHA